MPFLMGYLQEITTRERLPSSTSTAHRRQAPYRLQRPMVAEGGYLDAVPPGHVQDGPAILSLDFLAVDGKRDHDPSFQATATAPNLQASKQAPHLMHREALSVWGSFLVPVMAPWGHSWAQAVQPLHNSGLMV